MASFCRRCPDVENEVDGGWHRLRRRHTVEEGEGGAM